VVSLEVVDKVALPWEIELKCAALDGILAVLLRELSLALAMAQIDSFFPILLRSAKRC
jgi:hypothetical protein